MNWVQLLLPKTLPIDFFPMMNSVLADLGAVVVIKKDQLIIEAHLLEQKNKGNNQIVAIFENKQLAVFSKEILKNLFGMKYIIIKELHDKKLKQRLMDNYVVTKISNKLCIHPEWKEPDTSCEKNIVLHACSSFGAGKHSTTLLMLDWIVNTDKIHNQSVIDYGCGSGILSVVALMMNCKHVIAIDIEPRALVDTKKNLLANNIDMSKVGIYLPTDMPEVKADIIFANLNTSDALISCENHLSKLVKKGGLVLLSGYKDVDSQKVEKAFKNNFTIQQKTLKNDWVLLINKRI